ncbi:hypothetical protein AMS68_000521 [Peltaster fructicola]|uniref:Apple domain-containing protein n=1 Tax=Peltaster fructicola TaxID=286661 RepID=A0A6H0XJW0_9PEZI|nr:hypothetical protein AMS68_000521 [Peltaster fructicola]
MKSSTFALLFAVAVVAVPEPLVNRNGLLNCNAVNTIVTIMHEQAVATPFCSSYLHISETTKTVTETTTPCPVTTTTTVSSTDTVTTTSTAVVSSTTTVYPVVAVSVTSTCALGATVIQGSSAYGNAKRVAQTTTKCTTTTIPSPPPIGTPICLTQFVQTDLSSACSCLNIPTPTKISTTTSTAPTGTITSTVASTAYTTVTVTTTSTSYSTYSGTQYYTSTFTVLPSPTSTYVAPANPTQTFGAYSSLDFNGHDIQNFFCYQGQAPPTPFQGTTCSNFNDCVNECAYYNAKGFGSSTNTTCGAVLYNSPDNGATQGSCYLKTTVTGCGSPNDKATLGIILPLVATDPQ